MRTANPPFFVFQQVDQLILISLNRFYELTNKDPIITLQCISINTLYVFFNWLLSVRKGTLGATSTLQT